MSLVTMTYDLILPFAQILLTQVLELSQTLLGGMTIRFHLEDCAI